MKREELKNLGLSDEQIGSVMALHGTDVNGLKEQVNQLTAERDSSKEQLATVSGQLSDLQKTHKGDKDLQAEIDKLKQANEETAKQKDADLAKAKLDYKTELALTQAGALNTKAARAVLDMDKITLDKDGNVAGLDDQIKSLQKADETKFLFKASEQAKPDTPAISTGGNPNPEPAPAGNDVVSHIAERLAGKQQ